MIKLLQIIKQIMYSNGGKEMHTVHNQVMATINLFKMRQERGQMPQNFREQITAMRQVCKQLGLQIRAIGTRCTGNTKQERCDKPNQ